MQTKPSRTNTDDLLNVIPVTGIPDNLELVSRATLPTETFADKIHKFNAQLATAQFSLQNTLKPEIVEVDDEILQKILPTAELSPTFHVSYKGAILCTKNNKQTIEKLLTRAP